MDASVYAPKLEAGETVNVELDGEAFEVNKDYVIISIAAKEGFTVTMENNIFIILDTTLTKELIEEGYAREFISKIQQMRKNNNYEMMDRININFDGDDDIADAVSAYKDYIMKETLADKVERVKDKNFEVQELNGHETGIQVERV
jgi:isoleucyl-tRNA synthetase